MNEARRRLFYTEEDAMKEGVPVTTSITGQSIKGLFFPITYSPTGVTILDIVTIEYTADVTDIDTMYVRLTPDTHSSITLEHYSSLNKYTLLLSVYYESDSGMLIKLQKDWSSSDALVLLESPWSRMYSGNRYSNQDFFDIFKDPVFYIYLPLDQLCVYDYNGNYKGRLENPVIKSHGNYGSSKAIQRMDPPIYYVPA